MYVPLKVTTDYSLLKSTIKIDDLIPFLVAKKIPACAICDDYLYGVMEFYDKCKKNNIKPIIGLSIEIKEMPVYLYGKNYHGYQNLLKINTLKAEKKLKVEDIEDLLQNCICILPFSSICIYEELQEKKLELYIGYQDALEKKSASLKTEKTVYVQDIRALKKEDTKYLKYISKMAEEKRVVEENQEESYYHENVSIREEETTHAFAALLDVEIPKNENRIPLYDEKIEDPFLYLKHLTEKGLSKRLQGNIEEKYRKRLQYELEVIKKMGFVDYILIVYDYCLFAKKNGVFVGPGRGSAAGSLVCYTLGITDIDPLEYNLLFERFLNPERITMPDIDIDFENTKRGQVIDYIKQRYGEKKVASILTFSTLKSKLVLREVARILDITDPSFSFFIKEISSQENLRENLKKEKVQQMLEKNKMLQTIYKIALKLEGLKKNISTHAAGVVISKVDLEEIIPIVKMGDTTLTGVTMEYLEELGLLKMDLLAIKNLTMIANILELIKKDTQRELNLNKINLNDASVLNLFTKAATTGIFQFESSGMRSFLQKLKPRNFSDIVASIALYRPGPMENIDTFIKRKEGREKSNYLLPILEPILKETEGIIVYQEQVMQILVTVGSYTFAEADLVRRAMSKKKKEIILKEQEKFICQAMKNGYKKETVEELYQYILKFAGYGFNKSHSVSYALIGYQMAYLKVKFPKYFITNLLNMSIGSEIKTKEYLTEAKKHQLTIVRPNCNVSGNLYHIRENALLLPLSIIKGVNTITIENIVEEREKNGPYLDFTDFVKRTIRKNVNQRILEILIHAGVFEEFANKTTLKENLDVVLNYAELASNMDSSLLLKPVLKEYENEEIENKCELESFGFYITNHPASIYTGGSIVKLEHIEAFFDKYIKSVVLIESIKKTKTKTGEDMAFIEASDETDTRNFVVFKKQIRLIDNLKPKDIVEMQGRVTKRYDVYQINVNNIIKKIKEKT